MFGDWDWKAMEMVSRVSAGVWFWIFMLMIVMVMFNVLLAIIMDSYMFVKKKAQNAESLWQTIQVMRRRRQQFVHKERVRLNDIVNAIVKEQKAAGLTDDEIMDSERHISPKFLCELLPNIPYSQASRTLNNAQKAHDKEQEEPLELSEAHDRLIDLNQRAAQVRNDIFETFTSVDHYDTMRQDGQQDAALQEQQANLASTIAMASATANESAVNQQVLESVSNEVGRLTAEVASVLAQTMKKVDKKQNHLEQRQKEMLGSIREMQTKLQMIQSEASGLTTRIQRYSHKQNKVPQRSSVIPNCISCERKPTAAAT